MDDLYFIQTASGPVKIGRAIDAAKRLKGLQSGNPERLEVISVLTGRGYEERVWHHAFCVERIKGEWFVFSDQLEEALCHAESGRRWWDHVMPPPNYPLSDDEDERDAAEKIGLGGQWAGKAICMQDNGDEPLRL